jgi:hypothetical protein
MEMNGGKNACNNNQGNYPGIKGAWIKWVGAFTSFTLSESYYRDEKN